MAADATRLWSVLRRVGDASLYPSLSGTTLRTMRNGQLSALRAGCVLAATVVLSFGRDVRACGPCAGPELWSAESIKGELVVVANFGLLTERTDGWFLTCEETIGGLLLDVRGNAEQHFVSSDTGLYTQTGDICEWSSGPSSSNNNWFLGFSLPTVSVGTPTNSYVLLADRETSDLLVQRAEAGANFSTVHALDESVNFRTLATGGEPASVFVAGYDNDPRDWHIAYSLDAGDSWDYATPDVDTEYTTMVLRLVDPEYPRAVYIEGQTVLGQSDELWRFDAESGETELLLKLDDAELFSGITLSEEHVWVSGRRRGAGSLYRAERGTREFARIVDDGPEFGCIAAHDEALYVCVNDFTYQSDFILGRSTDQGLSWQPALTVEDLGVVASCGVECDATTDWLHGAYGISEADAGAPNGEGPGAGDDSDSGKESKRSSGGCSVQAGAAPRATLYGVLGLLAFAARRRRSSAASLQREARKSAFSRIARRSLGLGTVLATLASVTFVSACGGGDAADDSSADDDVTLDAGDDSNADDSNADDSNASRDDARAAVADCGERGDELMNLEVEADDATLSVQSIRPNPAIVGDNSWTIELRDDAGEAIVGAEDSIVVTPFMPDHGHGTPVAVGVAEEDDGEYQLAPVNTFMPGLWQITIELELDGATELFEFRVCVQ